MERLIQIFIQGVAGAIFIGGLIYGVYWFATNQGIMADRRLETVFEGYHASALVHRGRYEEFAGLCRDIGLPDTIYCSANKTTYRIWTKIDDGRFQCVDHTGFNGVVAGLVRSSNVCQTDN